MSESIPQEVLDEILTDVAEIHLRTDDDPTAVQNLTDEDLRRLFKEGCELAVYWSKESDEAGQKIYAAVDEVVALFAREIARRHVEKIR